MDLFDDIYKEKMDFPKVNSIKKEVSKFKFNFYQLFAIMIFCIGLVLGIIFGNLFATCKTSSFFYSDSCYVTEFNFSLMIAIWFFSLILSVMIFSVGHIIALLTNISEKLAKFHF